MCLLDSMVIKNKELAKGEGEYNLGIHLQIQEKKNLRLLSEISILSMFPQNDAGVGKKVQMTEQAQVLHLC